MFGKLKDKLKSALSIFSKKTEEEAEEKVVEVQKVIPEVKAIPPKEAKKGETGPHKAAEKKKPLEKKPEIPEKGIVEKKKEKVEQKGKITAEKEVEIERVSPQEVKITYFVHGTTTDNEKDLATGWNPGELSSKGIQQSKELLGKIRNKQFEIIFCSDLKRAVDSAHLTFGKRIPIIEDKRLRECNYGEWNGKEAGLFKSKLTEYISKPFPS